MIAQVKCQHCGLPITGKDYEGFIGMGFPTVRYYHTACHREARKAAEAAPIMSFFEQDRQQMEALKRQVLALLRRLGEVESRGIRANRESDDAIAALRARAEYAEVEVRALTTLVTALRLKLTNTEAAALRAEQRTKEAERNLEGVREMAKHATDSNSVAQGAAEHLRRRVKELEATVEQVSKDRDRLKRKRRARR